MSRRTQKLFIGLVVSILIISLKTFIIPPQKTQVPVKKVLSTTTSTSSAVLKIVDGDTVDVSVNGVKTKIRVIGINTPETVDPRKSVECFGKEASDKAKSILLNQTVTLKSDSTQSDKDKYGRSLRYITLPDGSDYGLSMIREGYAYEYTYEVPYEKQSEYKNAQKEAEKNKMGLWADGICK
jgi:micrococcal nuclease